jgi:hypothetical protein
MMQRQQWKKVRAVTQLPILAVFLFLAGLLPRLLALDVFLTPDEYLWLGRSRDFLVGILSGDLAATVQTRTPGVTTMWTGTLGILYRYLTRPSSMPDDLLTFVNQVPLNPLDTAYVAPMRFPTVLLTSLLVVAFYAFISRLFDDQRVGVLAALLLALDPFFIGLSRVLHHDALATTFMTLSLLPLLGYWLKGWSRRWLLLSAVAAGLSFLSKSPALFLMPFCALLGLVWVGRRWHRGQWRGWPDVGRLFADGLVWGVVAWLVVLLLWPAMWSTPLRTFGEVLTSGFESAIEGHDKGHFILGQIREDPGLLFYPLTWLYRSTPLTLVGLLALVSIYVRCAFGHRLQRQLSVTTPVDGLLLYISLFVALMTLGSKKMDRYILPVYPALDALAALGLVHASNVKFEISKIKYKIHNLQVPAWLFVLLVQGILVIANYPYYFTYYNPLLGGARTAVRAMTVGWGEGLEQAAAYLNSLPDAERLQIASWYPRSAFAPFFRGKAVSFRGDAGPAMSSDYAVVYRNQIQRELPTAELVNYFLQHHTPVHTVTLQGVDYVYVYHLPLTRRTNWEESRLPGRVTFFGIGDAGFNGETTMGIENNSVSMRLYWQNDGLAASDKWWVALQPTTGPMQIWKECQVRSDFADERLRVGALLESECQLADERLPSGVYHLRVGVGPDAGQVTTIPFLDGEFAAVVHDDGVPRLVSRMVAFDALARQLLPQETRPADLVYQGAVWLIGYMTETVSQGEESHLHVYLSWQALQPVPLSELGQALAVEMALLSPQGEVLASTKGPFIGTETSPTVWSSGQVLTQTVSLALPAFVPPQSRLRLDVWLNDQQLIPLSSEGEVAEPFLEAILAE